VDLRQWVSTAEGIVPTYPGPLEDEETSFSKKVSGILTAEQAAMNIRVALFATLVHDFDDLRP
jgi:hypothetical protein